MNFYRIKNKKPYNETLYQDVVIPSYCISPKYFVEHAFTIPIKLEEWQAQLLESIEVSIKYNRPCKVAVSAGHGVGKTTFICWLVLWFMFTRESPKIIVTANTHVQLMTRTWRELAKWHSLFQYKSLYNWQPTKYFKKSHPETWYATPQTWNISSPEAFAGIHGEDIMFIFDEASAIDPIIWETVMGAMTSGNRFWFAFGNPTRNTGGFYKCFHPYNPYINKSQISNLPINTWLNFQIDSRTISFTDKEMLQSWINNYGEDSDIVRIRVKGQFPRQSINQLISTEKINAAVNRHPYENSAPIIAGIDLASGTSDNKTVMVIRRGWEVLHIIPIYLPIEQVHLKIAELVSEHAPSIICVDNVAIGTATYNLLRSMHLRVEGVNGGTPAIEHLKYNNRRAEIYFRLRDFIHEESSCIPDNSELIEQLGQIEYSFDNRDRYMILSKMAMRSKGISSPDIADALAYTFAVTTPYSSIYNNNRQIKVIGYNMPKYI